MLKIAAVIVGLLFYWFRFGWPQIKRDIDQGETVFTDVKSFFKRDIRRSVHLFLILAPFLAVGALLDWVFDTDLSFDTALQ